MEMNPTITINKWSEVFETADSRKRQRLGFFYMPSGCDSSGYLELMSEHGNDGILAYGVFTAMCQIMATLPSDRRGAFVKSNGEAMSVKRISLLIHMDDEVILRSIQILTSEGVNWLSADDLPMICQSSADDLPPVCRSSASRIPGLCKDKDKDKDKDKEKVQCAPAKADGAAGFESFWEAFNFKRGKAAAEKAWKKATKHTDPETIIAGAEKYNLEQQQAGAPKRKWAEGWLNRKRWEDEAAPEPTTLAASANTVADQAWQIEKKLESLKKQKTAINHDRSNFVLVDDPDKPWNPKIKKLKPDARAEYQKLKAAEKQLYAELNQSLAATMP